MNVEFNDSTSVFHELQSARPYPGTRLRKAATSLLPLSRSDAFRVKKSTQINLQAEYHNSRVVRHSRIPLPTSPSQVQLQNVSNVSIVAPLALQNLGYITPPTPYQPPDNSHRRGPRKTARPFNYRVYHNTGYKINRRPHSNARGTKEEERMDARTSNGTNQISRANGIPTHTPMTQDRNKTEGTKKSERTRENEEEETVTQPSAASSLDSDPTFGSMANDEL